MTRRDQFQRTIDNIHLPHRSRLSCQDQYGRHEGLNDAELLDFVRMDQGSSSMCALSSSCLSKVTGGPAIKVVTLQEMIDTIQTKYEIESLHNGVHDTDKNSAVGHQGTFAVISTMSAPFCGDGMYTTHRRR